MEESEKKNLEPNPSVPSTVFHSIMSFAGGYDHDHGDGDDNDNDIVDENGYGYSCFFKPPMMMMMMMTGGSGSSSSPVDDMDMMMMFNVTVTNHRRRHQPVFRMLSNLNLEEEEEGI